FDALRVALRRGEGERNPWGAGTLEWVGALPTRAWSVRSIPIVRSRYPLWDQPGLSQEVDAGAYYLPDAQEGKRETLITSVLDAEPERCLRVPGPAFLPLWTALFTGGAFIAPVFGWYVVAGISAVVAIALVLTWLWTGTAVI